MISKRPWQQKLAQTLASDGGEPARRVAIVGVGHELNGDDVAGLLVARALAPAAAACAHVLVLEAGPAPENFTGALRRFAPEAILFVDAANLGAEPGAVEWVGWEAIGGVSASTHTLPLTLVASYLRHELGAEVALLGIQPGDVSPGAPLSPAVERAAAQVAGAIRATFGSAGASS